MSFPKLACAKQVEKRGVHYHGDETERTLYPASIDGLPGPRERLKLAYQLRRPAKWHLPAPIRSGAPLTIRNPSAARISSLLLGLGRQSGVRTLQLRPDLLGEVRGYGGLTGIATNTKGVDVILHEEFLPLV